jgi:hypothetical protein
MSSQYKKLIEDWATWIIRGVIVIILTLVWDVYNRFKAMEESQVSVFGRVQVLEVEVSDMKEDLKSVKYDVSSLLLRETPHDNH